MRGVVPSPERRNNLNSHTIGGALYASAMASPLPLSIKEKATLAVALSWGAGLIDVLGYLTLYQAFVAHMTGNTVSSVLRHN